MIEIQAIGSSVNYPERPETDIYTNEAGFGHWVFMHFTTPFRVRTLKGTVERSAGDFLINSPDYPQWHQGIGCCFKNDWIHFDGDHISPFFNAYMIPVNIPFTCFQESQVLRVLQDIQREYILKDKFQEEKLDLLAQVLFLELARGMKNQSENRLSEREKELLPLFQEVRIQMNNTLEKQWKVAEMAEAISMSPSRFAVLYKRFFNISPLQDLLDIRLRKASTLLLNQTGKVLNIANECGFLSEQYFWRVFKKHFRMSPTEYRKSRKSEMNR